jgi:hypothetical protein
LATLAVGSRLDAGGQEVVMTDPPATKPGGRAAENRQNVSPPPEVQQRSGWLTLLLQTGAIAGAIGSIVALLLAVFHAVDGGGGDGRPSPARPGQVVLGLPTPSVHRLTFRNWLIANGIDPKSAPQDQLDDVGVTVDYELRAPGYKSGTTFPVHFRILRQTTTGGDALIDEFDDPAQLEVDSDSCICTSSFFPIPRTKDRYRIEVQVFRPGPKTHSPLKKAYTEQFAGFS